MASSLFLPWASEKRERRQALHKETGWTLSGREGKSKGRGQGMGGEEAPPTAQPASSPAQPQTSLYGIAETCTGQDLADLGDRLRDWFQLLRENSKQNGSASSAASPAGGMGDRYSTWGVV